MLPMRAIQLILLLLACTVGHGQTINRAEYFIDADPGQGNGTAVTVSTPGASVNFNFTIPTNSLSTGFHIAGFRTRASISGFWSHAMYQAFYIVPPISNVSATTLTRAEYFFDADPGNGNGTNLPITSSATLNFAFNVPLNSLTPGFHTLHVRTKDNTAKWTHAHIQSFYIVPPLTPPGSVNLTKAEYFFDTDPGQGNGTPLTITSGATQNNSFIIPINGLSEGFHRLNVRYKNNAATSSWSHALQGTFYIIPAVALPAQNITRIEYFIDTDPGFGQATSVSFTPAPAVDQPVAINLTSVPSGNHLLGVRVKDDKGFWSDIITSPFIISNCVPPAQPVATNQSRCNDGTLTLTATGATGAQVYRWYDDPTLNNILFTGPSYTTPSLSTSKNFYVSIFDPGTACESGRTSVLATVINIPKPNINPSGSITICEGNSFILTAPSGFASYAWSNGLTTQQIIVNTSGNFSVVVGDGTCSSPSSDPIAVIISPKPAIPVVSTSGTTDLCDGVSVTLTAPAGFTYLWSSGQTTQAITASTAGNYSVNVADGSGCVSDQSTSIEVKTFTRPAKPSITVIGSTALCGANTVGLLAPAGFNLYQWSGGQTAAGINIATAGNYTVSVGNAANCLSVTSDVVNVTATGQPCTGGGTNNSPPVIDSDPLATQIEGKIEIDITAVITDTDNNIDFNSIRVVNGVTARGVTAFINSSFILIIDYSGIPFTGTDRVTIEVCDLAGACAQQVIDIDVVGAVIVFNGISPDGDGLNDFMEIKYVDVVEGASKNKVSIYNRWGDLVFEVDDYDNTSRVFTGVSSQGKELPAGTYFYKIDFSSGSPLSGFITLKR
jgi:gliding motility-associated-like protein